MISLKGIGASKGISIANVFKLEEPKFDINDNKIENVEIELAKFEESIQKTKTQLEKLKQDTLEKMGEEEAEIFSAHLLILEDPELTNQVKTKIEDKMNAPKAVQEVTDTFIMIFESMTDNPYMQERAADIKDIRKRIFANLFNKELLNLASIDKEVIIFAEDLTPSQTSQLNKKYVKGFVTEMGGRTSHSAIMARSLEIPAITGVGKFEVELNSKDVVIINGKTGEIFVNPTQELIQEYKRKMELEEQEKNELKKLINEKSETKDGFKVELVANIGTPNDLEQVVKNGAEGIGLYRTEFLYMDSKEAPTEEEQFQAYKKVVETMGEKPTIIRTLDIGGDKHLDYLPLPHELNPFLGQRAIRLCLDRVDLFKVQIRALLRASAYGNLQIMFPMISSVNEFLEAKAIVIEEQKNLTNENIKYNNNIKIGIMIEIPAAAICADQLAKHVDFFSIGTNDLIQYTMAADRMNENISYLYQPYNPAILKLVKMVVDAANKNNKMAGMCGEMASETNAIMLLLGLGLHEFSMSASAILDARKIIRSSNKKELEKLVLECIELDTQEQVIQKVEEYLKTV